MIQKFRWQLVLGVSLLAVFFILCDTTEAEEMNMWGICIGISDYQNMKDLSWADRDALDFCNNMFDVTHRLLPTGSHYTILRDKEATKKAIEDAFYTVIGKTKNQPMDRVYLFYSGHGGQDSPFLPYDADPVKKENFFSFDEISGLIRSINAREIIVIVDACYSGRLAGKSSKKMEEPEYKGLSGGWGPEVSQKMAFIKMDYSTKLLIMTSSDGKQESIEGEKEKNGLFTYHLKNTLLAPKGADTDRNGDITLLEVYQKVYQAVSEETLRTTMFSLSSQNTLACLEAANVPEKVLNKMLSLDKEIEGKQSFMIKLEPLFPIDSDLARYGKIFIECAASSWQQPQISDKENARQIILFECNLFYMTSTTPEHRKS